MASLEEPIASSSIVPMYFVCQRARQDVKVALVGQGPDELFGGYRRHLGVRYGAMWARSPKWMRTPDFFRHRRAAAKRNPEAGSLFAGNSGPDAPVSACPIASAW